MTSVLVLLVFVSLVLLYTCEIAVVVLAFLPPVLDTIVLVHTLVHKGKLGTG